MRHLHPVAAEVQPFDNGFCPQSIRNFTRDLIVIESKIRDLLPISHIRGNLSSNSIPTPEDVPSFPDPVELIQ